MSFPAQNLASAETEPKRPAAGWKIAQAAVLVLAGFFVFAPALQGHWLWDDGFLIRDNALMRDPAGWWKFWFAPPGPDYFPLTSTVEWSLWRVFGNNPLPFHLTSLALHLVSAFLLWKLFARLGLRLAWLGALLFVIHPMLVESAAWIAELKNTVSLPLLLLAMLAWLNYDERGRAADLSGALLLFMAALLAKTSVVMFPFVLLLYAWWKDERLTQKKIISIAQFFAIAFVLGVITMSFQREWSVGDEKILDLGGPLERLARAGWSLLFYFGKCFWPENLMPAYPRWALGNLSVALFLPWLVMAAGFAWLWSRRAAWGRPVLFGVGFFVLNLAPVLGLLSMSYLRIAWVADHFVYLPIIGLLGLMVAGADQVLVSLSKSGRTMATVAAAALVFVLAWQARVYAENFRGQPALWAYTISHDPQSWMAEMDWAASVGDLGRLREAEIGYNKSIALRGDFYGTHLALANILAQMGRNEEAVAHYGAAWVLKPDSLDVHVNYGDVLLRLGRLHDAQEQYELATLFHPESAAAHYNLANVLLQEGQPKSAMEHYAAALEDDPTLTAAQDALVKLQAAAPAANAK